VKLSTISSRVGTINWSGRLRDGGRQGWKGRSSKGTKRMCVCVQSSLKRSKTKLEFKTIEAQISMLRRRRGGIRRRTRELEV